MRSVPVLLLLLVAGIAADDYIDEVQGHCYSTNESRSCAKYQFFKYIDEYDLGNVSLTSDSSVKFISMPSVISGNGSGPGGRYFPDDSEVLKVFKFLKRKVESFVQGQGVSVELPEGVEVATEARKGSARKKDKKMIIFPILLLVGLFKVKIITTLILLGVVFIKKILLAGAFLLPGVVAAIKIHCKAQQFHVVPYHADEDHYTHDHEHQHDDESGYGYGDKHVWDKRKRFSYI